MQTLKKLSLFAAILAAASVTARPSDEAPRRHARDAAPTPGSDQLQSAKEGQPSKLPIKFDEPEGIKKYIEDFNHEYFPDAEVNSKLKINEPVLKPEKIHEHHLSEDTQDMINNAQLQYITLPLGVNANDALMAAMKSNQNPIIGYLQQYPSSLVKGANPQIKRQIIYQQTFITPCQHYQPNNQQQTSYPTLKPNQPQQQNLNQRQVYQTQPQNLQYIYNDLGRMSNVNYDDINQVPQVQVNDASNQNFRSTSNSLPFFGQQYFNPNARKDTNYFPQNYIRFEQNAPPQRYPYRKFSGSRSYMTLPQNIPLENSNQYTRSFNSNEDNRRLFTSLQPPSIQLVTYSNDQTPNTNSNFQNTNFNQESRNTLLTNGYNMNNVIASGLNMNNLRTNGFIPDSAQIMNGQALPFPTMTPYEGKDSSLAMVNSFSSLIEYGDPTENLKTKEQKILKSVEAQSAPDENKFEIRYVGATNGNDKTAEEERLGRIMTDSIRVGGTVTSEDKDSYRNVGGGTPVKHDVNKPQVGFVKFKDSHDNVEISRSVELELKDLLGQHQTRQLTLTESEVIPQGSESKKVEIKTGKNTPKLGNDSPPTEGNVKEKDAEEITVKISPNQHVIVMPVAKMDKMKSGNETSSSLETLDEDDDDDSEDGDQPGDDDEDEDDAKKPDVEIAFEEKPDKPRQGGDVDANNNDEDNENPDNNSNNPRPKQPVTLTTQGGSAPESGPVIRRLVVRRGGVAIAGPGGIATAGPGGVAVVGPGGTAYTEPNGVAIVGPGGKVVSLPADTLFNQGGIAVAHPDGSEPRLTKDYFPPGARIVAYGPTVYFHRVEPETI